MGKGEGQPLTQKDQIELLTRHVAQLIKIIQLQNTAITMLYKAIQDIAHEWKKEAAQQP